MKNQVVSDVESKIYKIILVCIIASSVVARFYQYIFHKDLWLDEAMLTFSITNISLWDMLSKPLPSLQSAPLGFLLWTRLLYEFFGAGEYVLYFLPFVCSLGTLFVAYKISQTLRDTFSQTLFMLLVCGSLGLLYYATEFKQYGIEAFCGFLLLYLYIKRIPLSKFLLISGVSVLFSHTIIFIAIACIIGYTWQSKHNLKAFLKQNTLPILALGVFFVAYYFLYLKHQAGEGFYNYWSKFFLPHNPLEYPAYIKDTLLDIYLGFTPFARGFVVPFYIALSFLGLVALYKIRRDLFIVTISALGIYVGLSLLRIYPFGHDGIVGGRLSLYMSSIFFLLCSLGGGAIYTRYKNIRIFRILSMLCLIVIFTLPAFYRHAKVVIANTHYSQQTHAFITQIATNLSSQDCAYIYKASEKALSYYAKLDNLAFPYIVFDADLASLRQALTENNCQNVWILASHFPKDPWVSDLETLVYEIDQNAIIYTNTGSMLIRLSHRQGS